MLSGEEAGKKGGRRREGRREPLNGERIYNKVVCAACSRCVGGLTWDKWITPNPTLPLEWPPVHVRHD